MAVTQDATGGRYVRVEARVPGSVEDVWRAVASGEGISSWFVPTTVEAGENGRPLRILSSFGPGMDSVSRVTGWEPPTRFTAESEDLGEGAPPVETEWNVESDGGTRVVSVVHRVQTESDAWDAQLTAWEDGWPAFFRLLQLVLEHFPGQPESSFDLTGWSSEAKAGAWAAWLEALGFAGAARGAIVTSGPSLPELGGVVELLGTESWDEEMILRLEEPAPGIAHLFAMPMDSNTLLSARVHFFGPTAAEAVRRDAPIWRAWFSERFPAPGKASGA